MAVGAGALTPATLPESAHDSAPPNRGLRLPRGGRLSNRSQLLVHRRQRAKRDSQGPGPRVHGPNCRTFPRLGWSWTVARIVRHLAGCPMARGSGFLDSIGGNRLRIPSAAFGVNTAARAELRAANPLQGDAKKRLASVHLTSPATSAAQQRLAADAYLASLDPRS